MNFHALVFEISSCRLFRLLHSRNPFAQLIMFGVQPTELF